MTDAHERELAYQEYINEVTPNGYPRLTNIILHNNSGCDTEQHIATQIDLAFQAGWFARADLPATDAHAFANPKVKALVEAVTHEREMACQDMGLQSDAREAVCNALDAALVAITKETDQ